MVPETNISIPCFRCGVCCRRYQVRLSQVEARRIADELGLDWDTFSSKYLDCHWPGVESFLLRRSRGKCVFLRRESDGKLYRCLIYPCRPDSCREWSPGLSRPECQEGLTRYWGLKLAANGAIEGRKQRLQRFRAFLASLDGEER